ncbi:DUF7666 domain-containing protein [Clostridioides difficile]
MNEKNIEGYKVFNPDWTCRDFKYEVGKTYKHEGNIELCGPGFHFCEKAIDCFNYYKFDSKNKVAKVKAIGKVKTEEDTSVTNEILIIEEISWEELLSIINTGNNNTGRRNSGNRNTGNCNTGDENTGNNNSGNKNAGKLNKGNNNTGNNNTGDENTGNENIGYKNSGHANIGDFNTGHKNGGHFNTGNRNTKNCNTGNENTGHKNSGNCNTGNENTGHSNSGNKNTGSWNKGDNNIGDCNIGNNSIGVFCTDTPKLRIFNKETNLTYEDWMNSEARNILRNNNQLTKWIHIENMSEEEKKNNPEYEILGGYLKPLTLEEMWNNTWKNLSDKEKKIIMDMPNFDKHIFKEITGIEVI